MVRIKRKDEGKEAARNIQVYPMYYDDNFYHYATYVTGNRRVGDGE